MKRVNEMPNLTLLAENHRDPEAGMRAAVGPRVRASILETVGDTPVVRVATLEPEGVELYVKLEAFNPLGSVKDRLALGVIEAAERDGSLRPG